MEEGAAVAEPDVRVGRGEADSADESCRSARLPCCISAAAQLAFKTTLKHNQILDNRMLAVQYSEMSSLVLLC